MSERVWRLKERRWETPAVVGRLIAEAEERGAARVRERVRPIIERGLDDDGRNAARDALHVIRAALTDEAQP